MTRLMHTFAILAAALFYNCQTIIGTSDVRNARWGMSMEQVKETETAALSLEEDRSLTYRDEIAGTNWVYVTYRFDLTDALVSAHMKFAGVKDESLHVELVRIMTEKYGVPVKEPVKEDARDDPPDPGTAVKEDARDDPSDPGTARRKPKYPNLQHRVSAVFDWEWQTPRTNIKLQYRANRRLMDIWYRPPPKNLEESKHLF